MNNRIIGLVARIVVLVMLVVIYAPAGTVKGAFTNFAWPVQSEGRVVTGSFGSDHNGLDITNSFGSVPIYAAEEGDVLKAAEDRSCVDRPCDPQWNGVSYYSGGLMVDIGHGDGWKTRYAHLQSFVVTKDQHVTKGQLIGYMGNSGFFGDPAVPLALHLHFGIAQNGGWQNPANYLNANPAPINQGEIHQEGKLILHNLNPSVGHTPSFTVKLKNTSGQTVSLNDVFLRLRWDTFEIKVPFIPGGSTINIPPGQVAELLGTSPPMDHAGRWLIENVEMHTTSGQWLPGLFQGDWLVVGYENWAKHQIASTSSVRAGSGNDASKLVDDIHDGYSRWESEWSDNQWLEVNLGQYRWSNAVLLRWENAYASEYRVSVHTNNGWQDMYETSDGKGGTTYVVIPELLIDKVRVELIHRVSSWGFSLWEVEAYNMIGAQGGPMPGDPIPFDTTVPNVWVTSPVNGSDRYPIK